MAQDFYTLFAVGTNNKTISTIDPAGVALIGIQEQQKLLEANTRELEALRTQVSDLKKEIQQIKALLTAK